MHNARQMSLAARLRIAGLLVSLLCGLAPAQDHPATLLSNDDVVQMLRTDQPPKEIIGRIKASACRFDLSVNGLRRLVLAGAPQAVLSAMAAAPVADLPPASAAEAVAPVAEVADERDTRCPKCLLIAISHFDAASKQYRPGLLSPAQVRWLQKDIADSLAGKVAPPFWYVGDRRVAEYDFAWGMQPREGAQSGNWAAWVAVYDARTGERILATTCEGLVRGQDPAGPCLADAALQLRKLLKVR